MQLGDQKLQQLLHAFVPRIQRNSLRDLTHRPEHNSGRDTFKAAPGTPLTGLINRHTLKSCHHTVNGFPSPFAVLAGSPHDTFSVTFAAALSVAQACAVTGMAWRFGIRASRIIEKGIARNDRDDGHALFFGKFCERRIT